MTANTNNTASANASINAEPMLNEQQRQLCDSAVVDMTELDYAEKNVGQLRAAIGKAIATSMGTSPTLAQWEAHRIYIGKGYKEKTGAAADAINVYWSRIVADFLKPLGLEKPKSESKGAEKKASERADKVKAVEEVLTLCSNDVAKLAEAGAKALSQGDTKLAGTYSSAIAKVKAEANKAAKDEAVKKMKDIKEEVTKLMKEATAEQLASIAAFLRGEAKITVRKKK